MRRSLFGILCGFLILQADALEGKGYQWGNVLFRPDVSVGAGYDNRLIRGPGNTYTGDSYVDWSVGLSLNNLPAVVNYSLLGRYGRRHYNENSQQNSDFYRLNGAVASGDSPFIWGLSSDLIRTLDYHTSYDPAIGQGPDPILTSEPSTRSLTTGNIGYDVPVSDLSSLRPSYSVRHYYQTFDVSNAAEWQIHQAGLQYRRKHSDETTYTLGVNYTQQVNDDEEGFVGSADVGLERRVTDKTFLLASFGYSHAEYELSGADDGFILNLRANWNTTDRISLYVFGGNDFVPGYDGGAARWIYRLGYGVSWNITERLSAAASVLHDYQDVIGSNVSNDPSLGIFRHFFNTSVNYRIWKTLNAGIAYRYVKDEEPVDQQIISFQLSYRY